ncbi:MAG: DUF3592 domain-containing protein [Planctomycetota bacterium]
MGNDGFTLKGFIAWLLIALVFTFLGWLAFIPQSINIISSISWNETRCVVKGISLETKITDEHETLSKINIEFEYDYQLPHSAELTHGRTTGRVFAFMNDFNGFNSSKNRYVNNILVGSTNKCYYNPSYPSEAVFCRFGLFVDWIAAIITAPLFFLTWYYGLVNIKRTILNRSRLTNR